MLVILLRFLTPEKLLLSNVHPIIVTSQLFLLSTTSMDSFQCTEMIYVCVDQLELGQVDFGIVPFLIALTYVGVHCLSLYCHSNKLHPPCRRIPRAERPGWWNHHDFEKSDVCLLCFVLCLVLGNALKWDPQIWVSGSISNGMESCWHVISNTWSCDTWMLCDWPLMSNFSEGSCCDRVWTIRTLQWAWPQPQEW